MKGTNQTGKWGYTQRSEFLSLLCNVIHQLQYLNKNEQICIL
jgi:hypothetical protein